MYLEHDLRMPFSDGTACPFFAPPCSPFFLESALSIRYFRKGIIRDECRPIQKILKSYKKRENGDMMQIFVISYDYNQQNDTKSYCKY